MKLNTRYASLVTLILAGAFSVSSLNAGPDPVSDLKVKEDVSGVSALEGKEKLRGSVEKSEKSAFHEIRNAYDGAYDIAVERDAEGALVVKNQEGEKIFRLDPKTKTLEIGDTAAAGVTADVIARQAPGKFISINLTGSIAKKDEKAWRVVCAGYGLFQTPDGRWGEKIQGRRLKGLVDELEAVETVEKESKPEEQSRIKMMLLVLDDSLTATLNDEYFKSDQFKKDYRDRMYARYVTDPSFKAFTGAKVWFLGKPAGIYEWRDGIKVHKHGDSFSMIDSNKEIMVFGKLKDAREFQEKLRKIGIVPAGSYAVFNNGGLLADKFGDEGALSITEATPIVSVDPNWSIGDYDDDQRALPKAIFLNFNPEDFAKVAFQYDQYAQQAVINLHPEFGKK